MVSLGNIVGDVCIQDVVYRWNISGDQKYLFVL